MNRFSQIVGGTTPRTADGDEARNLLSKVTQEGSFLLPMIDTLAGGTENIPTLVNDLFSPHKNNLPKMAVELMNGFIIGAKNMGKDMKPGETKGAQTFELGPSSLQQLAANANTTSTSIPGMSIDTTSAQIPGGMGGIQGGMGGI